MRVALFGGFGDGWATRVGQAKDFGNLIEAFANGIVAGGADNFEMIVLFHVNYLSVPARYNGRKKRELGFRTTEPVGIDVGFEVVGWIKRLIVDDGDGAGGQSANEKRADETGRVRDGNCVDVINVKFSLVYGLVNNGQNGLDMAARGDFGDNASVGGMDVDLRNDDIRKNCVAIFDNGGGSFVARRLNSQDFHFAYYNIIDTSRLVFLGCTNARILAWMHLVQND